MMRDTSQQTLRAAILDLLSDFENARVSNAEGRAILKEGDESIDLSDLARGIQKLGPAKIPHPGEVLPKSAVSSATWGQICQKLDDVSPVRRSSRLT